MTSRDQRMMESDRRWDLEALTVYGNVLSVEKSIDLCETQFRETLKNTEIHTSLIWSLRVLYDSFEDEIGRGEYLLVENENNKEFTEMFNSCQFSIGKEVTGNLFEWIMNFENEYTQ